MLEASDSQLLEEDHVYFYFFVPVFAISLCCNQIASHVLLYDRGFLFLVVLNSLGEHADTPVLAVVALNHVRRLQTELQSSLELCIGYGSPYPGLDFDGG